MRLKAGGYNHRKVGEVDQITALTNVRFRGKSGHHAHISATQECDKADRAIDEQTGRRAR